MAVRAPAASAAKRIREEHQGLSMTRRRTAVLILSWSVMSLACGAPKGAIAESSKTDECRADIVGALEAFKRDLGFDFEVSDADAGSVFAEAQVAKSYGRDGVRHEVRFGLDVADDGGCTLRLFERRTSQPGSSTMTRGNYGSASLQACRCE
jgi:hypothetical protein